ncbi:MAG: DUF4367 domain-containing protein [Eubacteriales bacterium]|nr:DUF4367 domain-containing protein [Eubacteriales bacterium]
MSDKQKDYSKFDQLSTEELETLLRNDFESDETSDMDAVLYIMEVIARRKQEAGENPDAKQAWKSFNENYRHNTHAVWEEVEDEAEIPSKPVSRKKKRIPVWLRVLGVAAVVAFVVSFTSIAKDAQSFNLWQIVAQWTSETFGFSQNGSNTQDTNEATNKQYNTLQEALDAYHIKEKVAPTWMPKGYELDSIEVTESPKVIYFAASYTNENGYILVTVKNIEGTNGASFEKDGSDPEVFEVYGIEHYLMSNSDSEIAVWTNGANECSISTFVPRDELKKIIQSIYGEGEEG